MTNRILFALLLIGVFSFLSFLTQHEPRTPQNHLSDGADSTDDNHYDTAFYDLESKARANYTITKTSLTSQRLEYWMAYQKAETDSARMAVLDQTGRFIETSLVNHLIPFWYGTPWSFEGHTNTPKSGEVACGYFVSTTLKHLGFNVNRYHLAQQSPQNEARSIACGNSVSLFEAGTWQDSLRHSTETEGLYFVGLDNHVGYLLNRRGELFFIHSNYIGTTGVTAELASASDAFSSSVYWVVPISTNHQLIKKWLLKEEVPIVKD